jgi:hypothetical protein
VSTDSVSIPPSRHAQVTTNFFNILASNDERDREGNLHTGGQYRRETSESADV